MSNLGNLSPASHLPRTALPATAPAKSPALKAPNYGSRISLVPQISVYDYSPDERHVASALGLRKES
jgi:hypothetical protein